MIDWLPVDFDYLWIVCAALGVLNIIQFAKARVLKSKNDHMVLNGHAPDGKILIPAGGSGVAAPPSGLREWAATTFKNPVIHEDDDDAQWNLRLSVSVAAELWKALSVATPANPVVPPKG